jgi:hypothetical protein
MKFLFSTSMQTHSCERRIFYFLFFPRLCGYDKRLHRWGPHLHQWAPLLHGHCRLRGCTHTFVRAGPASARPKCIRVDMVIYPLGNFRMDATVILSHGRPSSHCPHPRPSVRLTTVVNDGQSPILGSLLITIT